MPVPSPAINNIRASIGTESAIGSIAHPLRQIFVAALLTVLDE